MQWALFCERSFDDGAKARQILVIYVDIFHNLWVLEYPSKDTGAFEEGDVK